MLKMSPTPVESTPSRPPRACGPQLAAASEASSPPLMIPLRSSMLTLKVSLSHWFALFIHDDQLSPIRLATSTIMGIRNTTMTMTKRASPA